MQRSIDSAIKTEPYVLQIFWFSLLLEEGRHTSYRTTTILQNRFVYSLFINSCGLHPKITNLRSLSTFNLTFSAFLLIKFPSALPFKSLHFRQSCSQSKLSISTSLCLFIAKETCKVREGRGQQSPQTAILQEIPSKAAITFAPTED